MIVPRDIEKYLVRDEIVEKEYYLRRRLSLTGHKVYASNRRLFIKRRNFVRDVDYGHISSIELKEERDWVAVALGVGMCAIGGVLRWAEWSPWWALGIFGVALVILGLMKTQSIELAVVGLSYALKMSGHRSELDSLFRLVREKRV
jgi:hypothetical protein